MLAKQVGKVKLPDDIFGVEVRKDILHRVVRWQLAKTQQVVQIRINASLRQAAYNVLVKRSIPRRAGHT